MRWLVLLAMLAACGDDTSTDPSDATTADATTGRVLVFTRTLGYRHADAIAAGTTVLPSRLPAVDFTEDLAAFTPDNLARYRAVFFMYTSGNDVLDAAGKAALEAFVRGGGGWLGIHSATDTEYEWPFYQQMVIAHFVDHPAIQPATMAIEATSHPTMAGLETPWPATDEWYNFSTNPRAADITVLATIDETTYTGGSMGADHPMIWCHERLGGRVFYSELGHVADRWSEPAFVDHIVAAIHWVMGRD